MMQKILTSCLAPFLSVLVLNLGLVNPQYYVPSTRRTELKISNFQPPPDVFVHFWLLTRKNQIDPELSYFDDAFHLNFTLYNPLKKTIFLVHGYTPNSKMPMMTFFLHLYPVLLRREDANVILFDWSRFSRGATFGSTVNNSSMTAWYLAQSIKSLDDKSPFRSTYFHIITLDMGALVAGAAKQYLGGILINKITALDPATILLYWLKRFMLLSKESAELVEIIHTSGGYNGTMKALGHRDFYINGGTWPQPGCGRDETGACSIFKSVQHYKASIISSDFKATYCGSFQQYLNNFCYENPTVRLYNTVPEKDLPEGKYFLVTQYNT